MSSPCLKQQEAQLSQWDSLTGRPTAPLRSIYIAFTPHIKKRKVCFWNVCMTCAIADACQLFEKRAWMGVLKQMAKVHWNHCTMRTHAPNSQKELCSQLSPKHNARTILPLEVIDRKNFTAQWLESVKYNLSRCFHVFDPSNEAKVSSCGLICYH